MQQRDYFGNALKGLCNNALRKYKTEIINYFKSRNNSGFVEGINNKIKVMKRRCYGISNIKHFFQRVFLDLQGFFDQIMTVENWLDTELNYSAFVKLVFWSFIARFSTKKTCVWSLRIQCGPK